MPLSPESSIAEQKAELRRSMRRARKRRLRQDPEGLAALVARHFLGAFPLLVGPVGLFHALPSELDPAPLAEALATRGLTLALPVVIGRGEVLEFRRWAPGDPLLEGSFRVMEPLDEAEVVRPRTLVVPLLAFDEHGGRLGYGGGYYDRTIAELRPDGVLTIGWALEVQRVEAVPVGATDERLDAIATEAGVCRPGTDGALPVR